MSLTVVPIGGLCNRLRALLSAKYLSEQTQLQIRVEWGSDAECKAWFDDLFMPIDTQYFGVSKRPVWNVPARKRNLFIPTFIRSIVGYKLQHDCYRPHSESPLPIEIWRQGKHYLSTGYAFYPYPKSKVLELCLQPHLQSQVDAICKNFASYTVGVHIRRTDNVKSILNSPIQAFKDAIENEIKNNANVLFFLATDDEDLKSQLQSDYPNRFITQRTCVRRDTLQGINEAVVDLYCLASTYKLLGSYWSSFTDTAAEIGQMPVEIIKM